MKKITFYIYFACLSVYLPVSNKRQNDWTDRGQIFLRLHMTPGKSYEWSKFQKFAFNKVRFLKIFKIHQICFYKIRKIFVCFTMYTQRICSRLK